MLIRLCFTFDFGLQTLTVKSRLLTGENSVRIRGNPPIQMRSAECGMRIGSGVQLLPSFRTPNSEIRIQNADVAQQRQQQFRKLPGNPPHGSASLPVGPILCSRSSNHQSGRLRTARLQVRFLPGVPFCRVSPITRGAPLRTERLGVEIPHAAPIWPT